MYIAPAPIARVLRASFHNNLVNQTRQDVALFDRRAAALGRLRGQFGALQCHGRLNSPKALVSRVDSLTERSLETLVGLDQLDVAIRRANRRL
jgi:hypothetical protein